MAPAKTGRLTPAAVIGGIFAVFGSAQGAAVLGSAQDAQVGLEYFGPQEYAEYSWAVAADEGDDRAKDECPRGFIPVWTKQRCEEAAQLMEHAGRQVTRNISSRQVPNVDLVDESAEGTNLSPGCTVIVAEGKVTVNYREISSHVGNHAEWTKVPQGLRKDLTRVCYKPYLLIDGGSKCPPSYELVRDQVKCQAAATTFEGQAPGGLGRVDGVCSVGGDGRFHLQVSPAVDSHVLCVLKDIIVYTKGMSCPKGKNLEFEVCESLKNITVGPTMGWWKQANQDLCTHNGRDGCVCGLTPWKRWHFTSAGSGAFLWPYCHFAAP